MEFYADEQMQNCVDRPMIHVPKLHTVIEKMIKEVIWRYGQSFREPVGLLGKLSGPFYTGMSAVMNITQFEMTLHGPTSTSKQIAVATRFGGGNGMLIEFDNSKSWGKLVAGVDVSYL